MFCSLRRPYIEKADEPEDYGLFARIIQSGAKPEKMKTAHLAYRQHSTDQANIRLGAYNLMLYYEKQVRKANRGGPRSHWWD